MDRGYAKRKLLKKDTQKGGSVRSGSDLCRSVYGSADRMCFNTGRDGKRYEI